MEHNGDRNRPGEKSQTPPAAPAAAATSATKNPKKRRKVNHVVSHERPCARCIKRNIGHLCHDERRESDSSTKKVKARHSTAGEDEEGGTAEPTQPAESARRPGTRGHLGGVGTAPMPPQQAPLQIVQPSPVSGAQANALSRTSGRFIGDRPSDWPGAQSQYQDMHNYHPSYMFNTLPEFTNEFNLLNDFLNNSLLDDGGLLEGDAAHFYNDQSILMPGGMNNNGLPANFQQNAVQTSNQNGKAISRPASAMPTDKAKEYYLQAADPTGNDTPEERMNRLLQAKYDAGMLKPFNYVRGYAQLSSYMDVHINAASKQKILRQLDRFRPKFREKVQKLTDIELIYVEMWFEKTLMEYDRVFASMAIPACCWRRTGEIFRGNKEMAELIHVPIEQMRDGKIGIHEILTEDSLVNYWEKFGAIAFDQNQKALLTSCSLKNPVEGSTDKPIKCCFSFTIRRDENKM
ncbi:Transcription factor [Pseudogymnoascus australis]